MNQLQVVGTLVDLTSTILNLTLRLQQASNVLQQAHMEGWQPEDPRWTSAWQDADDALKLALDRLKA